MHKNNKNIKYLSARERGRYYKLLKIDSAHLTDGDVNEIGELELRADRLADRENATSMKRTWEGG
ncbi:MAG: hypothetical protein RR853_09305 [Aurantimicrobium sp.]|uniref:hypothetical protein n=1 Tax=Aurantimicrobium sp. TaxID=1930784 RepID=UPI002FCB14BF